MLTIPSSIHFFLLYQLPYFDSFLKWTTKCSRVQNLEPSLPGSGVRNASVMQSQSWLFTLWCSSNRTPISDLVGKPMGNKISTATPSTASAGIDSYVSELGDIQYERRQVITNYTRKLLRQALTTQTLTTALEVHVSWKLFVVFTKTA